jgi:hypothetical protein
LPQKEFEGRLAENRKTGQEDGQNKNMALDSLEFKKFTTEIKAVEFIRK